MLASSLPPIPPQRLVHDSGTAMADVVVLHLKLFAQQLVKMLNERGVAQGGWPSQPKESTPASGGGKGGGGGSTADSGAKKAAGKAAAEVSDDGDDEYLDDEVGNGGAPLSQTLTKGGGGRGGGAAAEVAAMGQKQAQSRLEALQVVSLVKEVLLKVGLMDPPKAKGVWGGEGGGSA